MRTLALVMAAAAVIGGPGMAAARTPAQTTAIVTEFDRKVWTGGYSRAQLETMLGDGFIEHHTMPLGVPPASSRADFINMVAGPRKEIKIDGVAKPNDAPTPPSIVVADENYVMLMTKRMMPYKADPSRTYERFFFDLYRVDAAGKIAERWDGITPDEMLPMAAPPPTR